MRIRLATLGFIPTLLLAAGSAAAAPAPQAAPQDPAAVPSADPAVIRPPAGVDPGINKAPPNPTPENGKMQVVPPPGAPGSNPDMVPK